MLLRPGLFEPSHGRGREPAGILAEQRDQRLLEVAGGDALEVENRDQHLEALRPACVAALQSTLSALHACDAKQVALSPWGAPLPGSPKPFADSHPQRMHPPNFQQV